MGDINKDVGTLYEEEGCDSEDLKRQTENVYLQI